MSAPAPIVAEATHVERQLVCPAELDQPLSPKPQPGPGAVVKFNAEGQAYLAARDAWGDGAAAQLTDAQGACSRAQ